MTGSGRILVVDDEPQIRRVMKTALTAHGYEAYEARTGEEALASLRASNPDLILLDMNMPGMGGMAACRSIRAVSETPIIVLSVRDREQDKIAALDAGADEYMTKPFSVNELMARIRANLRRAPGQSDGEQPIVVSDWLRVDFAARQVVANGREVRLTPKEFDLLHYFLANANKPITHRKLLQTLWGPDYGDEVEYLRVFVSQLRKKIEADPAHPRYIVTEPWVGYRFALPSKSANQTNLSKSL
jgi:two-component system, OmpR family, KDP operon response regulator KdpE